MRPLLDTSHLLAGDGSLRDGYIHQRGPEQWERFDLLIRQYELCYSFDGRHARFPGNLAVWANREVSHRLSVMLGQVSADYDDRVLYCRTRRFFLMTQASVEVMACA